MPVQVIMPALEVAQDNGKLLRWLKRDGDAVKKGEPLMEIETDKAAVEIESPADGTLHNIIAHEGDIIPVGNPIALIFATGEEISDLAFGSQPGVAATPVAQQIAKEHGIDLAQVKSKGGRVEKADVLEYVAQRPSSQPPPLKGEGAVLSSFQGESKGEDKIIASPKAKRLAQERGVALAALRGTGPDGAIIAQDIPTAPDLHPPTSNLQSPISNVWRIMAEHTTKSWVTVPHFFLLREVNASRLIAWRNSLKNRGETRITYTDLLVKLVAGSLCLHPRINAQWDNGAIRFLDNINIGLAVAVEEGLVVPVIQRADELSLAAIAARREDIVARANTSKLRPEDLRGGSITISNLGMYGIDAFNAIINTPQAAILAVGRIADRVVPVNAVPGIAPMMTLSLSCDHRVVDGARGAQLLQTLADLIEEPLGLVA